MRDVRLLAVVVVGVALGVTAAAGGGYLPTTWGWAVLGPAAVDAAALLLRHDLRVSRAEAAFVALLGLLTIWTAASLLWTDSVPRTVDEVERDLVYLATVGALVVLPRSRLLLGAAVLAAVTGICVAGLATHLFPDRYGLDADTAFRLARPLGYWNAMGALAAIGSLLALGLATDARSRLVRALASAAPVALVATPLLSQSRGAAIALAAGLAVALALHRDRARLALTGAVAGVPAAVAAVLAARAHELTGPPSSLAAAADAGHRLAVELLVLAAVALLAPVVFDAVAKRLPGVPPLSSRLVVVFTVAAITLGAVAALTVGGKAYDAFRAPTPYGESGLRAHLFSLSGHDRTTYWRVALDDYRDHPALGSGAGTFDLYWTRDRPFGAGARDAHNLYLETLAELGPVGLGLLLAALGAPFLALRSARDRALVPALAGAYAIYLVHAAADWDWELPTLTLTALVCGVALAGADRRAVRVRGQPLLAVAAAAVAALAVAMQQGNDASAEAEAALRDNRPADALRHAADATRWAPWAAEPRRVRADAERELGRAEDARRSARAAIAKDPRDWIGWFQLAYLTTGDEHDAALARMRALNPLAPP